MGFGVQKTTVFGLYQGGSQETCQAFSLYYLFLHHLRSAWYETCLVFSHSRRAPYWPLFSPRTRTPKTFICGGWRRPPRTFSTPQRRYVLQTATLRSLYCISFMNGSVYKGYNLGFSSQFGPSTYFSFAAIPPHFASKASVLKQELSSLLLKGAIEDYYSMSKIWVGDWFVTVDLKDAYFHIQVVFRWMKLLGLRFTRPATRLFRVLRSCFRTLSKWRSPFFLQSGVRMGVIHHRQMVTTDASLTGWGAVFEGRSACGV